MKKVLGLIAIVGFVACNSAETTAPAADTTKKVDTAAPVAADTTHKDTTHAAADTAHKAETPAAH